MKIKVNYKNSYQKINYGVIAQLFLVFRFLRLIHAAEYMFFLYMH